MATRNEKSGASVFLDTTSAQYALDKLNAKIAAYDQQLKQVNLTQRELASLQQTRTETALKAANIQAQIDKGFGASLIQQKKYLQDLNRELIGLAVGTQAWLDKTKQIAGANATLAEMKKRQDALTQAQKETTEATGFWGKNLDRIKSFFIAGGLLGLAQTAFSGIKRFISESFLEAAKAEVQMAQLKATLDNLGRTDSFDRISKKVKDLSSEFRFLNREEVLGVFQKLIDYGRLTEKQMNDLLPVIINFATKQRIPLEQATDLITRALQGNSKGLQTLGISMKDTGDEASRLNQIMTVLAQKVDGAGKAFGETLPGKIATAKEEVRQFKQSFGELLSELGEKTITVLDKASKSIVNLVTRFIGLIPNIKSGIGGAGFDIGIQLQADKIVEQAVKNKDKNPIAKVIQQWQNRLLSGEFPLDKANKEIALKVISGLQESLNLGISQQSGPGDNKNGEDAKKKFADFLKDLEKQRQEVFAKEDTDLAVELQKIGERYDSLRERAQGNKDALIEIENLQHTEMLLSIRDFGSKAIEEWNKIHQKLNEESDKTFKKDIDTLKAMSKALKKELDDDAKKEVEAHDRGILAGKELDVLQSTGKQRLVAELALLDEQERQELQKKGLTENEKLLIEENYRKRRKDAEVNHYVELAQMILDFAQKTADILKLFDDAKTNKENAELARLVKKNDKEKASYQKLLNGKLISQQEYNKKIAELDAEQDNKKEEIAKKQFERNKRQQIVQAIINGAMGITAVLAAKPGITDIISLGLFRAINIAFTVAATAAQIAAIGKQKYEKGGVLLNGPPHGRGGMPVINPATGRKEAEVEGGEVILSKGTVKNNPNLVSALLNSSMYANGARIDPFWKNRPYKSLDYAGINRTIQRVRHYESGGVFQSSASTGEGANNQQAVMVPAMSDQQEELLRQILLRLKISPKAYVVYSEIQAAGDKLDQIKGDAIFGKNGG